MDPKDRVEYLEGRLQSRQQRTQDLKAALEARRAEKCLSETNADISFTTEINGMKFKLPPQMFDDAAVLAGRTARFFEERAGVLEATGATSRTGALADFFRYITVTGEQFEAGNINPLSASLAALEAAFNLIETMTDWSDHVELIDAKIAALISKSKK